MLKFFEQRQTQKTSLSVSNLSALAKDICNKALGHFTVDKLDQPKSLVDLQCGYQLSRKLMEYCWKKIPELNKDNIDSQFLEISFLYRQSNPSDFYDYAICAGYLLECIFSICLKYKQYDFLMDLLGEEKDHFALIYIIDFYWEQFEDNDLDIDMLENFFYFLMKQWEKKPDINNVAFYMLITIGYQDSAYHCLSTWKHRKLFNDILVTAAEKQKLEKMELLKNIEPLTAAYSEILEKIAVLNALIIRGKNDVGEEISIETVNDFCLSVEKLLPVLIRRQQYQYLYKLLTEIYFINVYDKGRRHDSLPEIFFEQLTFLAKISVIYGDFKFHSLGPACIVAENTCRNIRKILNEVAGFIDEKYDPTLDAENYLDCLTNKLEDYHKKIVQFSEELNALKFIYAKNSLALTRPTFMSLPDEPSSELEYLDEQALERINDLLYRDDSDDFSDDEIKAWVQAENDKSASMTDIPNASCLAIKQEAIQIIRLIEILRDHYWSYDCHPEDLVTIINRLDHFAEKILAMIEINEEEESQPFKKLKR